MDRTHDSAWAPFNYVCSLRRLRVYKRSVGEAAFEWLLAKQLDVRFVSKPPVQLTVKRSVAPRHPG